MNRAEYRRLLLALKEDPNCLGKFREKYRNIYPFSDAVFKILMTGNPSRLVVFLNAMMGLEGKDRIKEFTLEPQEKPDELDKKRVIFDIVGRNERGEPVLVEVQQTSGKFYMDRLLYYTSRLIDTLKLNAANYALPHIYVLSVLTCNQFPKEPQTYFHRVRFVKNGEPFYPKLDFFFVEVEKFFKIDAKTPEERREKHKRAEMLRFFRRVINEEKIPAPLFKDAFYGKLLEDLSLKKYEDKVLLKEVGAMTDLLYVKQVVYDKGVRRGERHGLRRGAANAKREMAKAMLAEGLSVDAIARISGLPEDEIRAL